jgi:2-methylisocitrate lyase-like PEP mutase family enzyme
MPTVADKRRAFHELHRSGCFVIPNPWDIGSARYLQHLGFKRIYGALCGPNAEIDRGLRQGARAACCLAC